MKKLSLREKIGQLMVFGFKAAAAPEASEAILELIRDYHVGGIIFFARNIGMPEEILNLTSLLQRETKEAGQKQPLLICIDQENGVVRRLGEGTTVFPGAMLLGATHQPELAYQMGLATGKELKALGINWNLAPVVDVNNNPFNPVIGVRSYGEKADHVAAFGIAAMKGMQEAGVITTLKHFPGHGDTNLDSHLELPTILHDMERLNEIELVPFKKGIAAGADTIMTAHVYFPALEKKAGLPATLSHAVVTGLLRDTLGFDGVVTTDCMEMKAIADTVGTAHGAVMALNAGVDLIMISHQHGLQKDAIEAIVSAVEHGKLAEEIIDKAVARVQRLKAKYLSWDDIPMKEEKVQVPAVVGCSKHHKQALKVFKQGITLVKNDHNLLPLSPVPEHKVLVIYPNNSYLTMVEDKRYSGNAFGELIQEVHPTAAVEELKVPLTGGDIQEAVTRAVGYDTVILGTLTAAQSPEQQQVVRGIKALRKHTVVVAMRSPYDLAYFPDVDAYIAAYEFTTPALRMTARAIYGQEQVGGKLPVTIPIL